MLGRLKLKNKKIRTPVTHIYIKKDIKELETCKNQGIDFCFPNHDYIFNINVIIIGPEGIPYSGGMYLLNIKVNETNHPFIPPTVRFKTKIYHPNISTAGVISLNILTCDYSPSCTLYLLINSVQWLLSNPNPIDTENYEAGLLYLSDYELFEKTAIEWKYTCCPNFG